jgi:acetylglutamate kinase
LISVLLKAGFLPVLSSVAAGRDFGALNVNADEAAAALAVALKARRLVYLTDVPGVLDSQKKTIPTIRIGGPQKTHRHQRDHGRHDSKSPVLRTTRSKKAVKEINIIDGRAGLPKLLGTQLLP